MKSHQRQLMKSLTHNRLDGKEPSVFIADEVGALPSAYPIEAMRSGQLLVLNKLGFIISTKYPTTQNPFEGEVAHSKKILDGLSDDEKVFSLLYEPDDTKNWATNDDIIAHVNPLALEIPEVWDDLIDKRREAKVMDTSKEVCLERVKNDKTRPDKEIFYSLIDKWFENWKGGEGS